MSKHLIGLAMATVLFPGVASAGSCLPLLQPKSGASVSFHMTTLNKNGVASYVTGPLNLLQVGPRPQTKWVASGAPQLFSDRLGGAQRFAMGSADNIGLSIGVAAAPAVQVTLQSWGGVKSTFTADCSAGGVMRGSTPDVEYLIVVFQNVVL